MPIGCGEGIMHPTIDSDTRWTDALNGSDSCTDRDHQIIVIGVAVIVSHNAMTDHLLDEISQFMEENCEAEILEETREKRWIPRFVGGG